jgi:hypothetical protein
MQRPLGVTIIAILSLVSGLIGLLKGLAWLGIGGAAAALTAVAMPVAGAIIGLFAITFGIIGLVTAVFSIGFSWGAWNLKPWAWSLGVTTHAAIFIWSLLAVLGPALLSERRVPLIISGVVLFYLTRPEIKRAFGKP